MLSQPIYETFKRYNSLRTDKITALPIVILMPHSACNCRCLMCDIWKDNKNLKQLTKRDIESLLYSLRKLHVKQVLMSGGEAMLNPNFFEMCSLLKEELKVKISVLSTALTVEKNAENLVRYTDELILSLDGPSQLHDRIRNIPGAYEKMAAGIKAVKSIHKRYRITGRTVIHKHNYQSWSLIVDAALKLGLDQISFLPADVSSHAFNREVLWSSEKQEEVLIAFHELESLKKIVDELTNKYKHLFLSRFIAESPEKLSAIHQYYAAVHGLKSFPYKRCNAPWVSAVIDADGKVRPCFFHEVSGNIFQNDLNDIINSKRAILFRKELKQTLNTTCERCVCYLNLNASQNPAA